MKGLLMKDFKLTKGQKNDYMFIVACLLLLIIVIPGNLLTIGILGLVFSFFALGTISYDEFDNGNTFLFSLPITRKEYVLEKYIFGSILGITSLLLGTVVSLIANGVAKTGNFNEIIITAGSSCFIVLLILSIMLPCVLKLGSEKGRNVGLCVMGFIFAVIGLLLIKVSGFMGIDLDVLLKKLSQFDLQMYVLLCLLLSAIVLIVSYLISLAFMKKKEF